MTMKTEWWYDDATYHYSGNAELVSARLTTRDDGTVQLLIGGEGLEFENEDEASRWLADGRIRSAGESYRRFRGTRQAFGPANQTANSHNAGRSQRQMVITLEPGNGSVSET